MRGAREMIMVQSVLITGSVVVWVLSGRVNMRKITDGSLPRAGIMPRPVALCTTIGLKWLVERKTAL